MLDLFFWTCYPWLFAQPGTSKRPVDWCRNWMSALYVCNPIQATTHQLNRLRCHSDTVFNIAVCDVWRLAVSWPRLITHRVSEARVSFPPSRLRGSPATLLISPVVASDLLGRQMIRELSA